MTCVLGLEETISASPTSRLALPRVIRVPPCSIHFASGPCSIALTSAPVPVDLRKQDHRVL